MKYRYADMTWPECKAAADSGRVAVIPVGTYEDHGYHLPILPSAHRCGCAAGDN